MNKSDSQETRSAIGTLAELFNCSLTETALDLYSQAVGDLEAAVVERAIVAAAASSVQFPSPAQLRELANAAAPTVRDRAALAFHVLTEAISRIGAFRSPDFDDLLINGVVRHLGGWQRACDMPISELYSEYRNEFIKLYEMFYWIGASKGFNGTVDRRM